MSSQAYTLKKENSFCKILTAFCNTLEELSDGLHLLSLLVPDICSVKKKNDVLFCKTIPRVSPLAKFTIHCVRGKNVQNISGKGEQTIAVDCDSNECTCKCKCWDQEYSLSSLKCFCLAYFRFPGLCPVEQAQPCLYIFKLSVIKQY